MHLMDSKPLARVTSSREIDSELAVLKLGNQPKRPLTATDPLNIVERVAEFLIINVPNRPGEMRTQHDILLFEKRVVHSRSLLLEHVEPGAGNRALRQRLDQCRLIYNFPARRIDKKGGRLHPRELILAKHAIRARSQRDVSALEVGSAQELVQQTETGSELRFGFLCEAHDIVVLNIHAEGSAEPRRFLADRT